MFSRSDYMHGVCSHDEYYLQFLNPGILSICQSIIKDGKFNLAVFDSHSKITKQAVSKETLRNTECPEFKGTNKYFWSKSLNICILKRGILLIQSGK